jgi:hypothetical protein
MPTFPLSCRAPPSVLRATRPVTRSRASGLQSPYVFPAHGSHVERTDRRLHVSPAWSCKARQPSPWEPSQSSRASPSIATNTPDRRARIAFHGVPDAAAANALGGFLFKCKAGTRSSARRSSLWPASLYNSRVSSTVPLLRSNTHPSGCRSAAGYRPLAPSPLQKRKSQQDLYGFFKSVLFCRDSAL